MEFPHNIQRDNATDDNCFNLETATDCGNSGHVPTVHGTGKEKHQNKTPHKYVLKLERF